MNVTKCFGMVCAVLVMALVAVIFMGQRGASEAAPAVGAIGPPRYQLLSHGGSLWMLDQTTGELFRVSPAARDETARAGKPRQRGSVNVQWLPWRRPPITVTIPKPQPAPR